ncbi:hypothetical protein [Melghiribacillus thermohalophilus]|nr:hypothetical protein [Melghiribacillus thermohalophilus]
MLGIKAMMRKVADTPGPFAMAGQSGNFRGECLFLKWAKKEGK